MADRKPEITRAPSWARRHRRSLAAAGALLALVYVVTAVTVLPGWIVSLTAGPQVDNSTLLKAVTDTRGALLGLLAPLAVVIGGVAALLNYGATTAQNREVLRMQWRGQVTERFTRAIDQLGSEKLDVVLGAVYALEQIAKDSDELHWPIIQILTAYMREHARRSPEPEPADEPGADHSPSWASRTRADIQAIATVIGRRRLAEDRRAMPYLDLHEVDLRAVQWERAQLQHAILSGARLEAAILTRAQLQGAQLDEAELRRANIAGAQLQGARLDGARLRDAYLGAAHLEGASLVGAQLQDAYLGGAHLEGARLDGAHLRGAVLGGANLDGADLAGADLSSAIGLTRSQVGGARNAERALLPPDDGWEDESNITAGSAGD